MIVEGEWRKLTQDELDMLLFQARVQEREACAKIAESAEVSQLAPEFIAKAIRARDD